MTPDWLNETVRAFGRQMGLSAFTLNDRGAAGARFENGIALRFEYAFESLVVSTTLAVPADAATLKRLLMAAHPAARRGIGIRVAYRARTGEAVYAVRLGERSVSVNMLENVFRVLWEAADTMRRALA